MSFKVIENGDHKIYHGDVFDTLNDIEDGSIDLIFADPPYNIGKDFDGVKDKWKKEADYLTWCYGWLELCIQKLKINGSLYVMTSTQYMPYFDIFLRERLTILSRIIWSYDSSGVQAKKFFGSMFEPILFCVKDKANYTFNTDEILVDAKTGSTRKLIDYRKNPPQVYNSMKVPGNVWNFNRVRYRMDEYEDHPTQKPVALLERIIKASSNKGNTVLDPFSGTFTTSYVAKSLERRSIGIELQEKYVKIGIRRVGISTHYNDLKLVKEPKSYQIQNINNLKLFDEPSIYK